MKIRKDRRKKRRSKFPKGWEVLTETLDELNAKMREAESESHVGKRKCQSLWSIMRIHHQRSRYIYEMYKSKKIKRNVYEYALREGIADGALIAKWKKHGYEKLCCLMCIANESTEFGNVCICRVPSESLEEGKVIECNSCGCRGCASGD